MLYSVIYNRKNHIRTGRLILVFTSYTITPIRYLRQCLNYCYTKYYNNTPRECF